MYYLELTHCLIVESYDSKPIVINHNNTYNPYVIYL